MPIIAVINRKGGSGKSTVATHLAAWLSRQGKAVMLGDVDRQQSTKAWLKRRDASLPTIMPWAIDQKNVLRVPAGVTHVVLDTPGGMHGFELAKVIMSADAVLMPVCHSMFDRESAAACHAELMTLPRVASGRCQLAVVGMRIDARTRAAESLQSWAQDLKVPFLGVLRETQTYVKALESGLTVFDLGNRAQPADLAQWEPILDWLHPIAKLPAKPVAAAQAPTPAPTPAPIPPPIPALTPAPIPAILVEQPVSSHWPHAPRAASLMPAQTGLTHGNVYAMGRPTGTAL